MVVQKDNTKKLTNMSKAERKIYNDEKALARKTPEFFKDTAEKRTEKAIKALRTIGFMGKYEGTDEQKDNILIAIDDAVSKMKSELYQESKKKESFKL